MDPQVIVKSCSTGLGVFAKTSLAPLTRVLQFTGPIAPLESIVPDQLNYILRASKELYLTPTSDARFVNHSCDPNCYIDDDLYIVTRTVIPEGSELTISYNRVSEAEAYDWGDFWHPAWSFHCRCGSERCYGFINKYITDEVRPYAEPNKSRTESKHVGK